MKVGAPTHRQVKKLQRAGYPIVAGLDEVGRGPAAGPVTVGVVVLPDGCRLKGIADSKLLSLPQREQLAVEIKMRAVAVGIGWASNTYIDSFGLTKALTLASRRAMGQLGIPVDAIIIDGIHNYLMADCHTMTMPKADQSNVCVAAASIVAKVARDRYMELMHQRYPEFEFASHKGYLTAGHQAAIERFGLSPLHRRTWGGLQAFAING
jgi:ribonuclease HII